MRTRWGEPINDYRPRPYNRAEKVLPAFDNIYGEWFESSLTRLNWITFDVDEPSECWVLPLEDHPNVQEELDPNRFLLAPYPVYYRGGSYIYLRNLTAVKLVTNVTLATVPVRISPSTVAPLYDGPFYASEDGFKSWVKVSQVEPNVLAIPFAGTVEVYTSGVTINLDSEYEPQRYDFFNNWDDLGRQLNLTRLPEESNRRYRDRLHSVLATDGIRNLEFIALDTARRIGTLKAIHWWYQPESRQTLFHLKNGVAEGWSTSASMLGEGLRDKAIRPLQSVTYTQTRILPNLGNNLGISFWIKPYDLTTGMVLTYGSLEISLSNQLHILGQRLPIKANEWQSVSIEISGTQLRLALNGVIHFVGTTATWNFPTELTIGSFNGIIDELKIDNLAFGDLDAIHQELIPTEGYAAIVLGPSGIVERTPIIKEDLIYSSSTNKYYPSMTIDGPYELLRADDSVISQGHYNDVAPAFTIQEDAPQISYKTSMYVGQKAVIPTNLPYGRYIVYIADRVTAQNIEDYLAEVFTAPNGTITDEGVLFLKRLGDPLLWSTRYWGEDLYFYAEEPPTAPTQEIWDQDLY